MKFETVVYLGVVLLLLSCQKLTDSAHPRADSVMHRPAVKVAQRDSVSEDVSMVGRYFVVAVSGGRDYWALRRDAINAANLLGWKFDSLGRFYDPRKGIVCPDDSTDEIYSGEYFPRRPFFDSDYVSIEVRAWFKGLNNRRFISEKEMVVIAGLCDEKRRADSILGILKPRFLSARVFEDSLYLGCMH